MKNAENIPPRNPTMAHTVYCRTIDEVHGHLTRLWGDGLGLKCQAAFPREDLFPTNADGLVIDLDNLGLTPFERLQLVRRLFTTLLPYPVALNSYDLEPEVVESLQVKGVIVARRLDRNLLGRLARAIDTAKGGGEAA